MKVRVKLGSQCQTIVFEEQEPSGVTLENVRQSVSQQFHLENHDDFQLSLNKREALSGDDQTLDTFGIVSGDLLHVIGSNLPQTSEKSANQVNNRPQPLASYSSHNSTESRQHGNMVASSSLNERPPVSAVSSSSKLETTVSDACSLMDTREDSILNDSSLQTDPIVNRYLLEPLVIRESTEQQVPVLLSQLYQSAICSCESDALWVAIHSLMLESGFLPSQTRDPTVMPKEWKHSGFYSSSYDYAVTAESMESCSVVGVTVGSSVIIHGLAKSNNQFKTEHLQLRCADFVRTLSQDVPATYRALDRLSRQFKDTVCLPLINETVTAAGFPERQGLQALPYEIKLRVVSFLDARTLCYLGQTCQEFNSLHKDQTVWRILYIRAFGKPVDCGLGRNWYELFKIKYHQFKEDQKNRRILYLDETDPPWGFPGSARLLPIIPGLPYPHIVGGDYDVNPEFTSGIWNPLGGNRQPGPLLPQVAIPDPFSSGLGRLGMPGKPRSGAGNLTGSPFSSNFRGPFM